MCIRDRYLGLHVPTYYSQVGNQLLFVNQQCPGTMTTHNADGSTTVQECNGHGTCLPDSHRCMCSDRWYGFDCLSIDTVSPGQPHT